MKGYSIGWEFIVVFLIYQCVRMTVSTCTAEKKACNCSFDTDDIAFDMYENKDKINALLAGTVGALGALLLVGSGFGLWCCCKKRKSNALADSSRPSTTSTEMSEGPRNRTGNHPFFTRRPWSSDDDNDSLDGPPGYAQPNGPFNETNGGNYPRTGNSISRNIYRSGLSDDINLRVGIRGTPLSYGKKYGVIGRDWN